MFRELDRIAAQYGMSEEDRRALEDLIAPGRPTLPTSDPGSTLDVDDLDATLPRLEARASEGSMLSPRYEDLGLIGVGGMAEVRRVLDRELDRVLAMKITDPRRLGSAGVLQRFQEEARTTAQLEHPGIVPVHELGRLDDGRVYFTMKEVRGETLHEVTRRVHAVSSRQRWGTTDDGWGLHRLVDALRRVCEAVAHAHARGVVHRDLKPDNVMVGAYGEVLVLDWGLARVAAPGPDDGLRPVHSRRGPLQTRDGALAGTPLYMAPEQARATHDELGPQTDVYALGLILFELLEGRVARVATDMRDVLEAAQLGELRAPGSGPPAPPDLDELWRRCTEVEIAARPAHAGVLAEAIRAWQEGARRRERARRITEQARQALPRADELRARARDHERRARRGAVDLHPWDPVEAKRDVWALEDEAARLRTEADAAELEATELLRAALTQAPELDEAHFLLADLYRERHAEAEAHRDPGLARSFEVLLRAHDDGRHAGYLQGTGALTLVTDPPGVVVDLYRYAQRDRRLVPEHERTLGRTPLRAVELPMGSYLLILRGEGLHETRYPVRIDRQGHWDGVPPGASEPQPVHVPRSGELEPWEVYVPAGWFALGGDPALPQAGPRREAWVAAFAMARHPVTNADYLRFLNELEASGRGVEARAWAPRERAAGDDLGELVYGCSDGRWHLQADADGDPWDPELPVVLVSGDGARAYCAHVSGAAHRLPRELEWEKAARGVDGRWFPFGDALDPTWACMRTSRPGRPLPAVVAAFPTDDSPYGVRGMAGNVMDLCADAWSDGGALVRDGRLPPLEPGAPELAVKRGGAWAFVTVASRCAMRTSSPRGERRETLGFRVCRSWSR